MRGKCLAFVSMVLLCGCAGAPMREVQGPYETPIFSAMAKEVANDGSKEVLYKEWAPMYENGRLLSYGVFFVTDKGVYMGLWDTKNYRYRLIYKAPISYINSLSEDSLKKGDVEKVLIVKDKFGVKTGFGIKGRRAVRSIVDALMETRVQEEGADEEAEVVEE